MSWRWLLGTLAAVCALLVVAVSAYLNARPIDPAELARRCQEATPTWPNYDEDIKAQLGARPFAEWHGEPLTATLEPEAIVVEFTLSGPWAQRPMAMPVLLRDALGLVRRDAVARREGERVFYRFPLAPGTSPLALDSIEVRYPHHTRRLIVRADGQ